ncbi:MAG: ABC transporter ATP-binding protein [Ignavibacteriae bacterium]|nr:ABC transporter ATP-binding protein [Ignavibacteriota bacterium]MCB9206655.1 ABC transporter ATP-binding protein [Ignavibacteriales bacterium]MCB9210639.1 ABC transporter ATP-binding protein [Ignavibacteriales bacterium]MCB9218759.1 ABC transporter ATP-binding protein [Ignavibacteriales bacterium]MCB9259237.1 ABC transporter ATP-binding protein [Ignavibacteriales bacterium]
MILRASNIYKSFEKGKNNFIEVLKDVSLELNENQITVIVGASGAGKSTLLHILSGLDKPDKGIVEIDGSNIFDLSEIDISKFRNNSIGFIFQFHHLLPEFTASENIAIASMINGTPKKKAIEKSDELLNLVGLKDRRTHLPAELSGGEQQRVAIARALINNPKILFADEPTGNLDSKNSETIHHLFTELKTKLGITLLMVTHNQDLVKLADRVLEMKDGQVYG